MQKPVKFLRPNDELTPENIKELHQAAALVVFREDTGDIMLWTASQETVYTIDQAESLAQALLQAIGRIKAGSN